jgi:Uncharacterized protein conserved in bacteria (DUF2147)
MAHRRDADAEDGVAATPLVRVPPVRTAARGAVLSAILLLVPAILVPAIASARPPAQPTAAGLWERVDSSGAPAAWFLILDCNGIYQGKMVKIFKASPGQNPADWRCTGCAGVQKNAPVIGLTFINGMKRNGLAYEGGSILDPRSGSVYSARMDLTPDGGTLRVRGYLGIEIFGQTETWWRLPDNPALTRHFAACS